MSENLEQKVRQIIGSVDRDTQKIIGLVLEKEDEKLGLKRPSLKDDFVAIVKAIIK